MVDGFEHPFLGTKFVACSCGSVFSFHAFIVTKLSFRKIMFQCYAILNWFQFVDDIL